MIRPVTKDGAKSNLQAITFTVVHTGAESSCCTGPPNSLSLFRAQSQDIEIAVKCCELPAARYHILSLVPPHHVHPITACIVSPLHVLILPRRESTLLMIPHHLQMPQHRQITIHEPFDTIRHTRLLLRRQLPRRYRPRNTLSKTRLG